MSLQFAHTDQATNGDWADVLATFPLFAGVRKRHLRKLVRSATFVELARGQSVGAADNSLFVILGGEAKMLWPTPLSLRTGDYFGEVGVLDGRPHSLHVVAEHDLHVMKLPRQPVLELARRHPPVTMTLLKEIGLRLRPVATS
jgi:CRP/FNR family cyclic AMP-dependent transcriptional regulator